MRETFLKVFFVAVLVLLFFKPASLLNVKKDYAEISFLNSLNHYASMYKYETRNNATAFTDFVEFDPLKDEDIKTLNIYNYYEDLDKTKHIKGYNTTKMTVYFKKLFSSKSVTFILVDGRVYIDNSIIPVDEI